ncbi:MAG TPA: hypothetical protein QF873_02995 [Patescibacteria group bacterium]|nr:hypothetical protein [Patescibacteria group bacterium]
MMRRQVWVSRGKALWMWLDTPRFRGAYWEPRPWKAILFALVLVALCVAIPPLLIWALEIMSPNPNPEWLELALEYTPFD